ncbi:hypothetical protein [Paracoccus shanxieyensis]|uniref:Flagellar basal body-associated protein FliL n=1 Tax=Paracoccus shanxieyensis TaxID=2675752 RepID=A0A6L6ITU0_9RHOB|nr:hypothetical protein [Paracoccus shanxieyensis]MTH63269.1 hypothetical protein [Paracoccus shanxieyensis]MTH87183.1 hypothetical protein [Paracoccus shanxieyensis]
MKKILMLVLPLLAFLGGAVGGDMLGSGKADAKTDGHEKADGHAEAEKPEAAHDAKAEDEAPAHEPAKPEGEAAAQDWFKFPNQFFVPVMRNGRTDAVMVLSLTLEIPGDARPRIEAQEHRLRDALLNGLMIEANTGAFDGNFTAEPSQDRLRKALLAAARTASGPDINRVLIEDIARQEQ